MPPSADPPSRAEPPGGASPRRRLRLALFGSPAFALPMLEALHEQHALLLVVAQPDKPAGRGMRLRRPPTVERAERLGVPVAQPPRLRGNAALEATLAALELDVAVTTAYGKILPVPLLEVPRHGFLNAHASLLPKYRGAAPIQWAIIRGEEETGVTIMQTEAGMDTGPIRHVARRAIGPDETAPDLFAALAELAASAMLEALRRLAEGRLPSVPQDDALATLAPLLTPEDGNVRWQDDATAVYDRYRGVAAWPGTRFLAPARAGTEAASERVKVTRMRPAPPPDRDAASGQVLAVDPAGAVTVACGAGAVELLRVVPPGGREMTAYAWANGRDVRPGARLG